MSKVNSAKSKKSPPSKSNNSLKTVKRLISYLKPYKFKLITAIICSILSTIFTVIGPFLLGNVTTEIANGAVKISQGTGGINFDLIYKILLTLLSIYVLSQIFAYLQTAMMAKVSQLSVYNLRKQVTNKINKLPLNYFDTNTHGEVLSKITNDIETINTSLQQAISQIVISVITIIGIIMMMLYLNIWMTLIALLVIPLSFTISMTIVKKSQKYYSGQQEVLTSINGHVEEMYSGHNVIKVFNREKYAIDKFEEMNKDLYTYSWKSQFFSSMMMPMVSFASNIGYVLLSVIGGIFTINGYLTIGNIQSFLQYSRNFMMPIGQISQIINILQSTIAASERVFDLLDESEEIKETENDIDISSVKGNVTFNHIKFGYSDSNILIKDCSVSIKSGQKVAIVGPTGAGKTTLINLLMRFYDVKGGKIEIDGIDIRDLKRDTLRSLYGMVLQDTWVFKGTIRENIEYGRLGASEDEVKEAAKLACSDHFIKTLPNGYDMILNEEANNVSGGQKQLLTIARAILSDPTILILDEATSSVDTRTEQLIQKAMVNLMRGRTSFVIAHRLSTIKDADVILVMKDGDIIESGNHQELMNKKGFYEGLYNSQFSNKSK